MTEKVCPNCNKPYQTGDEICRYCGFVFPFSTVILPSGTVLKGRYEVQQLIHSGGMGYVYLAKDKNLFDRTCIVKQVRERIHSEEHQKKLEEEALRMAKLNHPNVAMILDHFVELDYYFLVVERIQGKTLSEVFKECHGQLKEGEVVRWAIAICDLISYIHKEGVIHRDISPDNIMLTEDGAIKFIDFGTLREFQYVIPEGTAGMGKYGYTPPEQWEGRPEPRSDIFALGATLYYLLTGFLPLSKTYQTGQAPQKEDFNPQFPLIRSKNPTISPQLEDILQKALQLNINKRYTSAMEMRQALGKLEQEITKPKPKARTVTKRIGLSKSRKYIKATIITIPVLVLIGVGLYLLTQGNQDAPPPESEITPIVVGGPPITVTEDYTLTQDITFSGDGFIIRADNITLDLNGHTITGEPFSADRGILVSGRNGITIKDGTITGFSQGIQLGHADNNIIQKIISQNNTSNGIHIMSDSDNNLIDDCTFTGNTDHGIYIDGSDGVLPSKNNTVQNCTVSNNPDGINVYHSVGNSLVSNTINNFPGSGIFLKYSESNHVLFNRFSNDGVSIGQGIHLDDACNFNVIQGNNISTCGVAGIMSDGIDSEENLVQGNNISNCGGVGIDIHGTQNEVRDNNIENTSGPGIRIRSSNSEVIGNKVSYSARNGIMLMPTATGNSVEENQVSYSGSDGIAAVADPNGSATGNTIMKNKVMNSNGYDLRDWHTPTPANTWIDNLYTTSNF